MTNPPEYPHDPSQQPYGQQPQQPQPGGYPSGQYYQQPGVPPQQPAGGYARPAPSSGPGFFGALFDFSFREFVTTRIIKIVYILWLVMIAFGFLGGLVSAISVMGQDDLGFLGFLMLVGTFVGTAISVLLSRIVLELLIVVFRISEDLSTLRQRGGI